MTQFISNVTFDSEPRVPHPVAQARAVIRAEVREIFHEIVDELGLD